MKTTHNLPDLYLRFFNRMTKIQHENYEKMVADLENNDYFMMYQKRYNASANDAYLDHMYKTVNYKMCLLRDVRRLEWLDKFSDGRKQVILDIGCGTGYFSWFAAKRGHTVYSLDAPPPCRQGYFPAGTESPRPVHDLPYHRALSAPAGSAPAPLPGCVLQPAFLQSLK